MSFVVVETCQIFLFDDYYCKKAILWPRKVHFWTKKQKDVIYDGTNFAQKNVANHPAGMTRHFDLLIIIFSNSIL